LNINSGEPSSKVIEEFLTMLALCHTVIPETDAEGRMIYTKQHIL